MSDGAWTATLADAVGRVAARISEFLPNILGFVLLLAAGWLLARLLRRLATHLCERTLARLARQRVAQTRAIAASTEQSRTYQNAPVVLGAVVYWTVFLFFVAAAIEALGLAAVSNVIGLVTAYLPQVLAGVAIIFGGLWAGEFVRTLLARASGRAGLAHGELLGRLVQVLIMLVVIIVAVEQIGIESTVLVTTFATVFAATFGAAALAFGLGARTTVSNIIASRYVGRSYRSGDTVSVGEHQGRIIEITPTAVMLDTEAGRLMVPASRFMEEVSVLVRKDH